MPQAVHLLEYGVFSSLTIRPKGQASTHLPQPVQSLRLIIQTPFGFWVMAPEGQAAAHLPHWTQTMGLAVSFRWTIFSAALSGWNSL